MDSRDGITTAPTAMEEGKEYYVCANFQEKIKKAVDSRERKSAQLDPQAKKRFCMDGIKIWLWQLMVLLLSIS